MNKIIADPMEKIIAEALDAANYRYTTDLGGGNPSCLDFRLENGVEIEVKQFHTDRITKQMARVESAIAVQGRKAVDFMADLIRKSGNVDEVKKILEQLRCGHKWVDDDSWYSCAQHEECLNPDRRGKPCDCGADAHNALVDHALELL